MILVSIFLLGLFILIFHVYFWKDVPIVFDVYLPNSYCFQKQYFHDDYIITLDTIHWPIDSLPALPPDLNIVRVSNNWGMDMKLLIVITNCLLLASGQLVQNDFLDFYRPENVKAREFIINYTPNYKPDTVLKQREYYRYSTPDIDDTVAVCRYVTHMTDWASVTTVSSRLAIEGSPFTTIKAMVDGPYNISTGVPYFYISHLESTTKDLMKNRRTSLVLSVKSMQHCQSLGDNDDPACARVILTGKIKKVNEGTSEHTFATNAMTERHPHMNNRPGRDLPFVTKLKINQVGLMDAYGEADYISVSDYLSYNYTGPFAVATTPEPFI